MKTKLHWKKEFLKSDYEIAAGGKIVGNMMVLFIVYILVLN